MWSSSCAPGYLLDSIKNVCSQKNLLVTVYSSFTHDHKILEATNIFFNRWINCVDLCNGILFNDEKKFSYQATVIHGGNLNAYF